MDLQSKSSIRHCRQRNTGQAMLWGLERQFLCRREDGRCSDLAEVLGKTDSESLPSWSGALVTLGASLKPAILAALGGIIGDNVSVVLLEDCFLFLAHSSISASERATVGVLDLVDMVFSEIAYMTSVPRRGIMPKLKK